MRADGIVRACLNDWKRTIDLPAWYAQNAHLFERTTLVGGA